MNLPSRYMEKAVEAFASLPGVGRRTALRLTLHLLKRSPDEVKAFSQAFSEMTEHTRPCKICHNLSDQEVCQICQSVKRNKSLICVVEDIRDVLAIEATQQHQGVYHVLGGLISPMDGVGPADLTIDSLINRVKEHRAEEIILALSTTMEGDTTNFYIYRKLSGFDVKITTIARGISIGDELEYADEVTLGKSILNRLPYENSLSR